MLYLLFNHKHKKGTEIQSYYTTKAKHLTIDSRRLIERWKKEGKSNREIASLLGKTPQTIHTQIKRGTVLQCVGIGRFKKVYSTDYAQQSYESAGIKKSSHITQRNRYIKQALTMSGLIAANSKDPAFSSFYNRISQRGSKMRAIIACAHKILILFENLFKLRQRRLAVYMLLTSSVSSATSKQCFELTSSVLSTTSKQCFEQPAASFLVSYFAL